MRSVHFWGVLAVALAAAPAHAGQVSSGGSQSVVDLQVELCKDGVVDKDQFVIYLMREVSGSADALFLYPVKNHSGSGLSLVRTLLSEPNACAPKDGGDDCGDKANDAVAKLRLKFQGFVSQSRHAGTFVGLDNSVATSRYFGSSDKNFALRCVAPNTNKPAPPKPGKNTDPLRIRGTTQDLVYNRASNEFKTASAAKLNFNDDRSSGRKQTTKISTVIGYSYTSIDTLNLTKKIIPYVSINQTMTDQDGQRKLDNSNYFAGGTVINWFYAPSSMVGHSFSTTPQFLYDTKDRSQIANFRLDYQPYLNFGPNAPFGVNWTTPSADGKTLLGVVATIRSDVGYYVRKGDIADPTLHTSFGRAGGQFGFALKLVDYRLTLKASEWLLYGYAGTTRKLDLFDSSITYSFDPNDYFGLEFDYKRGRDLDTTNPVQQWTIALTAKY